MHAGQVENLAIDVKSEKGFVDGLEELFEYVFRKTLRNRDLWTLRVIGRLHFADSSNPHSTYWDNEFLHSAAKEPKAECCQIYLGPASRGRNG